MNLVAKSDYSTGKAEVALENQLGTNLAMITLGNKSYASYAVASQDILFTFTAPYPIGIDRTGSTEPHPNFSHEEMQRFILSKL